MLEIKNKRQAPKEEPKPKSKPTPKPKPIQEPEQEPEHSEEEEEEEINYEPMRKTTERNPPPPVKFQRTRAPPRRREPSDRDLYDNANIEILRQRLYQQTRERLNNDLFGY